MTEKQRTEMYKNISAHGENLRKIFSFPVTVNMIPVCKKLFSLENKTNKIIVDYCNGFIDCDTVDYASDKTYNTLLFILRLQHFTLLAKALFINIDPRGYALKINVDYVRDNNIVIYTDMGGYGILAPDFRIYKP